ncbi:MAG TPA: prolyl oligopeptidase family serine peptidase [Verrucomicrobiota bacterium]|nr:prolyl oligopeptidase family serine peptidase [Verrucomicrobiota bacterium]
MFASLGSPLAAQSLGQADRGEPGDAMIHNYLRTEAEKLEDGGADAFKSVDAWKQALPRFRQEYFEMLGLWPLPTKSPLNATVTGSLDRGDYVVELLHYQSRPGLYVTANLYRPAMIEPSRRLPGILYVCGHSSRPRSGNKTAYQSHGIWFARHGYVCLMVDTLQLGEIAGIHHGTYREGRWSWLSRGYTPAGVECWNGIRGLDYLMSRPEVDPARLGVTGISGGGAATFWIAAADERVKVSVPVSGMADLRSYIPNRVINGHCDCMFLYNAHQWPWTRIAELIAPRPLLFVNSDLDSIFPMDANERVINRLERLYSLFGAGDLVDSLVSVGGHEYRRDIRQATYRFFNTYFKNDPSQVLDSEVDLVTGTRDQPVHPIPPEQLRVFPRDSDIPKDERNTRIDQEFVPAAQVDVPGVEKFGAWREELLTQLRRLSFPHFPKRIPAATATKEEGRLNGVLIETEPGITVRLRPIRPSVTATRIVIVVSAAGVDSGAPGWIDDFVNEHDVIYVCEPRGFGSTTWTRKNPPNYVERAHYLLGRTVDSGRVWDVAATGSYLTARHGNLPVHLIGEKNDAVLAVYAALLGDAIASLTLREPPSTHANDSAPQLLNVLRVCDIPEAVGMLTPRPVTLVVGDQAPFQKTAALYRAGGAGDQLILRR